MAIYRPNTADLAKAYFCKVSNTNHKQYEALRSFFVENLSAEVIAKKFGYDTTTIYTITKRFRQKLKDNPYSDPFFRESQFGRKIKDQSGDIKSRIIMLRKQYLAVTDIKAILDSQNVRVSERYISSIIKDEGFSRLPRRSKQGKKETLGNIRDKIKAPKSYRLKWKDESFSGHNVGLLSVWPILYQFGLDKLIQESSYPGTKEISKKSSILSFLALKMSSIRRYSADDLWCMDRSLGLFSGLNVLPKAAWFSSYSHRVTRDLNVQFLKSLHQVWETRGLLSDTMNLDFTTVPYWGDDDSHLENNWSGKRHHALSSILVALAQDPDSGIIDYGNSGVRHKNESDVVIEFLDFYRAGKKQDKNLKYLVFDSKFTTYQNLNELNKRNVKFITIRRRGKKIVEELEAISARKWKIVRVLTGNNKGRTLKVFEKKVRLSGYEKKVRQIAITGHGKVKPALVITNDFKLETKEIIRKYCQRWIVEKGISEQVEFFHLNRVSSSMVIKVDFDFTMTILAHNVYRLLASYLDEYSHLDDQSVFEKFLKNSGTVEIVSGEINVYLKKKRNLPKILSMMQILADKKSSFLFERKIHFLASSSS